MLPETDVAKARRWVADRNGRIPAAARDQVRYELEIDDRSLTVLECRPPWQPAADPEWTRSPVVRLRYTKSRHEWVTYWRDSNLKFHRFDLVEPSGQIEDQLAAIDEDPTGIFWG